MKDLFNFLSSREAIFVYVGAALACLICIIIYIVEKNNVRLKQRHNTRELNKLVNQIKEEAEEVEEESISYDEPVLEQIVDDNVPVIVEETIVAQETSFEKEDTTPISINEEVAEIHESEETLQYTSIEPNPEEAQKELKKLTEELQKQNEVQPENITLTNYEEQQEEEAIISLEELLSKSKNLYEANELTQYIDEGNEPISLQELEKKVGEQAASYSEPFIIENVIPEEDAMEVERTVSLEEEKSVVNTFSRPVVEESRVASPKFKNSPIISPIYGIEEESINENDMELENTANYEKLDAEIKRTSEFLMTLKELQKRLD